MFCVTVTQRERVLTLLFYLHSVNEMITFCDPVSITPTFPATGTPASLWSCFRVLILIDNQTKTASDECKELDFYMSFKNGICAALCFTAIFQITQNVRKQSSGSLRKAVQSTFLFILGHRGSSGWRLWWLDYLSGQLIVSFLCVVTNIFRLQLIIIIQHNHRHIVHIRA